MSPGNEALEMYSQGRRLLHAKLIERAQLPRALDKLVKTPHPMGRLMVDIDGHQAIMLSEAFLKWRGKSTVYSLSGRSFIQAQPVQAQVPDKFHELSVVYRLAHIGVCSALIAFDHVLLIIG